MDRSILIIIQEFPPPITGGSIRVYKFAKYLSRLGWKVLVICRGSTKSIDVANDSEISSNLLGVEIIGVADLKQRMYAVMPSRNNKNVLPRRTPKSGELSSSKVMFTVLVARLIKYLVKYIPPDSCRFIRI